MITGLGIDLVELHRIERSLKRFGIHFCHKILHQEELAYMPSLSAEPSPRVVEWVSGRFAAKEAAFKALGTGIAAGLSLHDVRICPDALGKPQLLLHGKAEAIAQTLGTATAHVSLTHSKQTAAAVVILSR